MNDGITMTSGHPNEDRLIAYANDELRPAEATPIADHIVGCASCANTVARYRMVRDFVRADQANAPPATAIARAKSLFAPPAPAMPRDLIAPLRRIIADLVFDNGGGPAPALAGFRGAGDRHLTYEAEAVEIDVQATPAGREGEWRLLGQLAAERDPGPIALEIVPTGEVKAVARATSDEHGVFEVVLPSGRYDVVAHFPDVEVVVPDLELG